MVGYELMLHPRCERVASRTAGYDCVNNPTVRELKGGDPRTDHSRKGTTRTPGWHPEEAASQLLKHVAQKPCGGHGQWLPAPCNGGTRKGGDPKTK